MPVQEFNFCTACGCRLMNDGKCVLCGQRFPKTNRLAHNTPTTPRYDKGYGDRFSDAVGSIIAGFFLLLYYAFWLLVVTAVLIWAWRTVFGG